MTAVRAPNHSSVMASPRTLLIVAVCLLAILGCTSASLKDDIKRQEPSFAEPPASQGLLAGIAASIRADHGEEYSGFRVLDTSHDGLLWRLALIDSATTSLDIQTYLWYPDHSGILVLERAMEVLMQRLH